MVPARLCQIRRSSAGGAAFHSQQTRRKSYYENSCPHGYTQERRSEELLLQTLCDEGRLQSAMSLLSSMHAPPSNNTYMALLKACIKNKALHYAKQVHSHLSLHCTSLTGLLGDYLVVTLAKCGAAEDAVAILRTLPRHTVFSWTSIISAYADAGYGSKALEMYLCMQEDGLDPDAYTFVSLFKACGSIPDLEQGKKLHAEARAKGFVFDVFVGNTLVSMYGKCGAIGEAEEVFCGLSQRDRVSWNAMISAYVEQGHASKALKLYRQMQHEGKSPDSHTVMFVLRACSIFVAETEDSCHRSQHKGSATEKLLEIGKCLHAVARKKGFSHNLFISNTLVNMYGKCRAIREAEDVLSVLSQRDVVTWTAMLSACIEKGQGEMALHMYRRMQEEGVMPDQVTFVMAIQACATIAETAEALVVQGKSRKIMSLEIGKALHADAQRNDFASDLIVGNALLNLYGKCRAVQEAEEVFGVLTQRDIVSWCAMLSSYIEDGHGDKALWLYRQMQDQGLTLNDVAFVCILQACRQTGSLEICKHLHFELVSIEFDEDPSVAATLIHAYGSCANMVDAQDFFEQLSKADFVLWTACIAGHAEEGNYFASLDMLEKLKLVSIKPDNVVFASALSACNHTGLVDEALKIFQSMKRDYDITPNAKHCGIVIDLLGRAGDFKRVENMLGLMKMQVDSTIWLGLLGACSKHANLELAEQAFRNAVSLQPKEVTAYILMSNIYADVGLQESAAQVIQGLQTELESA
eukprot:c14815_g1_i2 orf=195-2444(-)